MKFFQKNRLRKSLPENRYRKIDLQFLKTTFSKPISQNRSLNLASGNLSPAGERQKCSDSRGVVRNIKNKKNNQTK